MTTKRRTQQSYNRRNKSTPGRDRKLIQARLAEEDFTRADFTRMEHRARREMNRAARKIGGAR